MPTSSNSPVLHDTASTGEPELPFDSSASMTKSSWSHAPSSSCWNAETTLPTLVAANAPSGKPRTSTASRSCSADERPTFHGSTGSVALARSTAASSCGSATTRVSGTSSAS